MIVPNIVKINSDRGYGDGLFEVVSETKNTYRLRALTPGSFTPVGSEVSIYKALTHRDGDCVRKVIELRKTKIEKAQQIDTKKRK